MDWQSPTAGLYWGWGMIVILAALTVLGVVLTALVLRKAGRSPLWSLLFLFPLAYVIGLWVFAFTRWPAVDQGRGAESLTSRR